MAIPYMTIILPTLNESENILILLKEIFSLELPVSYEVLVVDDASIDGTAEIVEKHFPSTVRTLRREGKHRGLTSSLQEAIDSVSSECILWMDADLQMCPRDIPHFVRTMQDTGAVAVIGSRFLKLGGDGRDEGKALWLTFFHKLLSNFFSSFSRWLLGLRSTDLTSGFIMIQRNFLTGHRLEGMHGEYFINLIYALERSSSRVVEIPYKLKPREKGVSKSTGGSFIQLISTGLPYLSLALKLRKKDFLHDPEGSRHRKM